MENWKVELAERTQTLTERKIQRNTFQVCGGGVVTAMMPHNYILRNGTTNYKISRQDQPPG